MSFWFFERRIWHLAWTELPRHSYSSVRIVLVVQEQALKSSSTSGADDTIFQACKNATFDKSLHEGSFFLACSLSIWDDILVEAIPQGTGLVCSSVADADGHVDSSWTDKGLIKTFDVIGSEEEDAFFGTSDTVKGVEKTGESDIGTSIAIILDLLSAIV